MANADKRSVHTDALETLGTIIGPNEARDAIHLAVEPVVAGEDLEPGEDITIKNGVAVKAFFDKALGIVDPFIKGAVSKGDRFWLVVYPRKITSLRHVWTHPDFEAVPDLPSPAPIQTSVDTRKNAEIEESKAWIRRYAEELSEGVDEDDDYGYSYGGKVTYDDLMSHAATWVDKTSRWGGDYLSRGGTLEGVGTSEEFWDHYEVITGKRPSDDRSPNFFSCSC